MSLTRPEGWRFWLTGILLLWLCADLAAAPEAASRPADHYVVGVVPQYEVGELHAVWGPLLDRLGRDSGVRFELVGSPSIPEFEQSLARGEFDFAYLNPYHMVMAHQRAGYEPLVRDTGESLYGVLVVRRNGDIHRVDQLDGKTVAFPAPNALGASLLMRAELHDRFGIAVVPSYVKTHDSVYLNVVLGSVAAGGGVLRTLERQPAQIRDALRILHTTDPQPSHPFAVHPRVPATVQAAVRAAFIALGAGDDGRKLLAGIPMQHVGAAHYAEYRPLEALGLDRFYVQPN